VSVVAPGGSGQPAVETAGDATAGGSVEPGRPDGSGSGEAGGSEEAAGSEEAGESEEAGGSGESERNTAEQAIIVVPPLPAVAAPAPVVAEPAPVVAAPTPAAVPGAGTARGRRAPKPGRRRGARPGPADEPTRAVPVVRPQGEPRRRNRLLPRTVLGLATLVLATSVGAAFSGVALYSYYEYRLSKSTDKINTLTAGYQKALDNARADLNAQRAEAKAEIDKELAPLRQLQASGVTLQALVKKVAPSMFFVHTLDSSGQPSVGSAFVVASDATRSLLLTSYTTVAAATVKPGPDLFVRQGVQDTRVTVWTWDARYDLALIVLAKGGLPVLGPAPAAAPAAVGDQVFAVSGLGSLGASAVPGVITDVSAEGLQHSAPVGQAFQGGPLLNSAGQVLAVASRTYRPLNFASDGVWFAPYELSACSQVLTCPAGTISGQPAPTRAG
jgi:hypothetical protein